MLHLLVELIIGERLTDKHFYKEAFLNKKAPCRAALALAWRLYLSHTYSHLLLISTAEYFVKDPSVVTPDYCSKENTNENRAYTKEDEIP